MRNKFKQQSITHHQPPPTLTRHLPRIQGRIQLISLTLMLLLLNACTPQAPATATPPVTVPTLISADIPETEWDTIELIAQAEQLSAPSFVNIGEETVFSWTGSQGTEARHFSRNVDGNTQIMALSAYFPQQQQLFPIDRGALMVWLDRTDADFDLRLQVGTFSDTGVALVGPVAISNQRTRNYSAIELDERQIRLVWSGGLGEVTNLYLHQVDHFGRPVSGDLLRIDADYPALLRDNLGAIHLFWLEDNGRSAYHAQFDEIGDPALTNIRRITGANISGTDTITHFNVGFDGTQAYLFWNIRRINDSQLVLMSHGQLADERFSLPVPLFTSENQAVQWLNPAQAIQNPLPVVANSGNDLLLLLMQDGAVTETEFIAESGELIGLPNIMVSDAYLAVSWAQPTSFGYANLFYSSRRHNP